MKLRKIPLEPLMQILQDLWEGGADFIDISGEQNEEGEDLKDRIQITVKPEYVLNDDDEEEDNTPLSDEDFNELI
jgi:hypothetical protein